MGPNRVDVSSPHLKKEIYNFRNIVFYSFLEFRTMDKFHESSDFVLFTTGRTR
jgi:hypothetical protein